MSMLKKINLVLLVILAIVAFLKADTLVIKRTASGGGAAAYNLGTDTAGGSAALGNADEMTYTATAYTTTSAGTVGNACVYGDTTTGPDNAKIVIYDDASPHSAVCTSDAFTINDSTAWYCEDMSDDGCGTLDGTYMLAVIHDDFFNTYWAGDGDWDAGIVTGKRV